VLNLQISRWGNSLAVRIPADYARQIGAKEGDRLSATVGADGALNLRLSNWSRKSFAQELARDGKSIPAGKSVIEDLRHGARY